MISLPDYMSIGSDNWIESGQIDGVDIEKIVTI